MPLHFPKSATHRHFCFHSLSLSLSSNCLLTLHSFSFTHSFVHSFTYHALPYTVIISFSVLSHSITQSLTRSITHSLKSFHSLSLNFTYSFTRLLFFYAYFTHFSISLTHFTHFHSLDLPLLLPNHCLCLTSLSLTLSTTFLSHLTSLNPSLPS